MRLPACRPTQEPETRLEMIDWLTVAGARLEESSIFLNEGGVFARGVTLLESLADPATGVLSPSILAAAVAASDDPPGAFEALARALLILTGQSDNALKCQFPVYLNAAGYENARNLLRLRAPTTGKPQLPAVKLERVVALVGSTGQTPAVRQLVEAYFACAFEGTNLERLEGAVRGLIRASPLERAFLQEVMAVTAIRGSATASGGHAPEQAIRSQMQEWGLLAGLDFNTRDVDARELATLCGTSLPTSAQNKKSRAFDFVLPYRVSEWKPRVLVQAQFYAGDSGSVSHKNVDQTPIGRDAARAVVPDPLFAEMLDGAGYVTALSGDAAKLLSMTDTSGLLQLRTACVRLREILQRVGFCTPLEVAHAVWSSPSSSASQVHSVLTQTYSAEESRRGMDAAVARGWITGGNHDLAVHPSFFSGAAMYALLDLVALQMPHGRMAGLAAPGYGPRSQGVEEGVLLNSFRSKLPGASISDEILVHLKAELLRRGWLIDIK